MSHERGAALGKGPAVGLAAAAAASPDAGARTARWRLAALWTTFLLLDAVTQLAFKWGGLGLAGVEFGPEWLDTAARSIAVWVAIAGYGALFVVWVIILRGSDLSRAFALTGVSFVTVPMGGMWLFGEEISFGRWCGIALIAVGLALMTRSAKAS